MGFSISWIAFHGKTKPEILAETDLIDTGEPDEANESPISGAEFPNGWYILFLNKYAHPFTVDAAMKRFSAQGKVLGCHVEEHVMASVCFQYENGARTWQVTHESEKGRYDVVVEGTPPPMLATICAECTKAQDDEGGEEGEVDHMFEVPLELARRLCGYKHDEGEFEWGDPQFTRLASSGEANAGSSRGEAKPQAKRGFLDRLFGSSR